MPRKHTHKVNIRGGGEETKIQANIRNELERILCVFTLDVNIREDYTVSSFTDNTSDGAKLIIALRDLYSSKSMKGSDKAIKRNELIVRIIKLIIDEPKMFRENSPDLGGYQHKVRSPIIPPTTIPILEPIFGFTVTLPSMILNAFGQCVGNLCNLARTITDEEAFENLEKITRDINSYNQEVFEYYKSVKGYFDDKQKVPSLKIAKSLLNKLNVSHLNHKLLEPYIDMLIQRHSLLYFISSLNYELAALGVSKSYGGEFISACLTAIGEVKQKEEYEEKQTGGANLRHRKKTRKRQRRHIRSTLLLKQK